MKEEIWRGRERGKEIYIQRSKKKEGETQMDLERRRPIQRQRGREGDRGRYEDKVRGRGRKLSREIERGRGRDKDRGYVQEHDGPKSGIMMGM